MTSDQKSESTRPTVWFLKPDGSSFSRSNSLRPSHSSVVQFHIASFVFYSAFGGIAIMCYDSYGNTIDGIGWLIVSVLFLVMAMCTGLILAANWLRIRTLAGMNRADLRMRLLVCQKEPKFHVSSRELLGMRIGAVFFTGMLIFGFFTKVFW